MQYFFCLVILLLAGSQQEIIIPTDLPLVQELGATLREWAQIWHKLYVVCMIYLCVCVCGVCVCVCVCVAALTHTHSSPHSFFTSIPDNIQRLIHLDTLTFYCIFLQMV